ncbi:hypothetical protein BHF93_01940 [Corynebacterium diphtheriae]|nr:hypothetical protein BHF82_02900 [Corynebacterium diphtheriae]OIR96761.1 hypothetical protein BHF93_01940 [Corynebacterium diphtheriae]OIS19719.1 hypothetical protein BHF94_07605 [Corynebacterium diphtheriae]OIS22269.1 hypothetical protein BHF95_05740 [Corynebacterium diphtheriae]OWN42166.1 hypothetical protein AY482_06355 [Corynebacterium diphtheriae bv. gravis]
MFHHNRHDLALTIRLWARVLVSSILEVRTAIILQRLLINTLVKKRENFLAWRTHLSSALIVLLTPLFIQVLQIGNNQRILGSEQGVQTRLGYISLTQNAINADHPNSLGGKKLRCAIQ